MEKIKIAEIVIDYDKAVKESAELNKKIGDLKKNLKEAQKNGQENTEEYVKQTVELKQLQKEYRNNEKALISLQQNEEIQLGTLEQLSNANTALRAERAKLDLNTKEGQKRIKEINKEIDKNNKEILKNSDNLKKQRMNVGNYTDSINKAIPASKGFTSAVKMIGGAFRVMLGPLGLIIASIASLITYFKSSEEGQNRWNTAMAVAKTVISNFMDVVSKIGETLVNAFIKPRETLDNFKLTIKSIGDFFSNTFGNVIGGSLDVFVGTLQKAFAKVGLAWEQLKDVFTDNADGVEAAQERINEKNSDIEKGQAKIKEGVENLKNSTNDAYNSMKKSVQDFIDENKKEIDITLELQRVKNNLDKMERKILIQNAVMNQNAAKIKEKIYEKDKYTAEERMRFLEDSLKLEQNILDNELKIKRERLRIKKEESEMSLSTKQDLEEIAKMEADLINFETSSIEKRRRLVSQRAALSQTLIQEQLKVVETEIAIFEAKNRTLLESDKKLTSELIESENERLEKIKEKKETALKLQLESELMTQSEYDLRLLELDNELNETKTEMQKEFQSQRLEAIQADYENELELAQNNIFSVLEIEKQGLELKRQQEIEEAEKIGADVSLINEKYRNLEIELERAKADAKMGLAKGFTDNLSTIFGEQTEIGKAAAIASTTIETYKAAQMSYSSLAGIPVVGPALGLTAAAAAIANGIANVRAISSTSMDSPSTPTDMSTATASTSTSASIESYNASIGEGVAVRSMNIEQSEKTQVVLVTDDVTYQQNLKNNEKINSII